MRALSMIKFENEEFRQIDNKVTKSIDFIVMNFRGDRIITKFYLWDKQRKAINFKSLYRESFFFFFTKNLRVSRFVKA